MRTKPVAMLSEENQQKDMALPDGTWSDTWRGRIGGDLPHANPNIVISTFISTFSLPKTFFSAKSLDEPSAVFFSFGVSFPFPFVFRFPLVFRSFGFPKVFPKLFHTSSLRLLFPSPLAFHLGKNFPQKLFPTALLRIQNFCPFGFAESGFDTRQA